MGPRKKFWRDEAGTIAIIFALVMLPVLGVVGLALDVGTWFKQKTSLVAAADAAALAGTRAMVLAIVTGEATQAKSIGLAATEKMLRSNGADPALATITALTSPPRVRVEVKDHGKKHFSALFLEDAPTMGATSEAVANPTANACIIALHPTAGTGILYQGSVSIVAQDCSIWSNSQSSSSLVAQGGPQVEAVTNCAVGAISISSNAQITTAPRQNCFPVHDPLAKWQPPSYLQICRASKLVLEKPGIYTLSPGAYCGGLTIKGGAHVTLLPGLYVFKDGPFTVEGGGNVVGLDVSLLLTGTNAALAFGGVSRLDLSAPTSGSMAGIVIAAGSHEPVQSSVLRGSTSFRLEGHIYLPTHNLRVTGGPEGAIARYTTVAARTLLFDGSNRLNFRSNGDSDKDFSSKAFKDVRLTN